MYWLLNPRLWIAAAILAALAISHFYVYRAGENHVTLEWKAAVAQANAEARALEQRRQSAADQAAVLATKRKSVISADSARTLDASARLRRAIAARSVAEESAAAATKRADTYGKLLAESAEAYRELAERCDRHVSDLRLLLEAWPR